MFISDTEIGSFGWQIDSDSVVTLPVNDGSQAQGDVAQLQQCENQTALKCTLPVRSPIHVLYSARQRGQAIGFRLIHGLQTHES